MSNIFKELHRHLVECLQLRTIILGGGGGIALPWSGGNKEFTCVIIFVWVFAGVPVSPRLQEVVFLWEVRPQHRIFLMAFPTAWMAWVLSCMAFTACLSQANTTLHCMMAPPRRRPVMSFPAVTALSRRLFPAKVTLMWRMKKCTPLKHLATRSPPHRALSAHSTTMTFLLPLVPSTRYPGHLIRITMPWHSPTPSALVLLLPGLLSPARGQKVTGGVPSQWMDIMELWHLQCHISLVGILSLLLRTSGFIEVTWMLSTTILVYETEQI